MKCAQCGFLDTGKFCSNCGGEMSAKSRLPRPVAVILGPLYEYFRHAGAALFPGRLAAEVESRRMDLSTAIGFLFAAMAISAMADPIFPSLEKDLEAERRGFWGLYQIPVAGEAIRALLQIAVTALAVSPMHFVLRKHHPDISYKMSVTAVLALLATLYPWTYFLELVAKLTNQTMRPLTGLVTFLILSNLYAALFRVRFWRVLGYFALLAAGIYGLSFVVTMIALAI